MSSLRVLDRAEMGEEALLKLAGDAPAVFSGADPFHGQKLRTKEILGAQKTPAGGDQDLLKNAKLIKHISKSKGYKADERLIFADTCVKINDKVRPTPDA